MSQCECWWVQTCIEANQFPEYDSSFAARFTFEIFTSTKAKQIRARQLLVLVGKVELRTVGKIPPLSHPKVEWSVSHELLLRYAYD